MNETVSVDDAIRKGHLMITLPAIAIMFGSLGITIYLAIINTIPDWAAIFGFLLSFLLPFPYWSYTITKWRLWAFDSVKNAYDLQKRAVEEKLIWPEGSFFEKTEIRNREERERLQVLQHKFDYADIFHDDVLVPDETRVSYSRKFIYFNIVGLLLLGAAGVYFIIQNKNLISGLIALSICIALAKLEYKKLRNNRLFIIINNEGIETIDAGFFRWEDIEGEEISYGHLCYTCPTGYTKIKITGSDITRNELEQRLRVYRVRSTKRNNHR